MRNATCLTRNWPSPVLQRDELLNIVGLYRALGGGWESVTATADVRAGSAALVKPAAGQ